MVETKEALNAAWKKHRQHILNALDHSDHAFSESDILLSVVSGEMQVWSGDMSILVTQVREYPNFKAVSMVVAGGDLEELRDMEKVVIGFAKEAGITKACIIDGRKGWLRALDGYRLMSVNLSKDI